MKLSIDQQRKLNSFIYDPLFLNNCKDILLDYIYSSLACSFISLKPLELEILYYYSSNIISKKKANFLILEFVKETDIVFDFDSFLFFSKMIKDAYKFCDGIFIKNNSIYRQKKLYLKYKRFPEILSIEVTKDLSFLKPVLLNKKIINIYFKDRKPELSLDNVIDFEIEKEEIKKYNSFFEWFDVLKLKIMVQNFDVAFISLGMYSNILNHFISQNLNKIAITKGE